METFIFKVDSNPDNFKRSCFNREISVWRIKKNAPYFVGSKPVTTASYKGDRPTAENIISMALGYKMKDGYHLEKEVRIFEV